MCDQLLICYIECTLTIPNTRPYMELGSKESWIKFFMRLIRGICGNNYYNVFDNIPNKYKQLFTPFTGKVIRAYSKLNKLMDHRKKCCASCIDVQNLKHKYSVIIINP